MFKDNIVFVNNQILPAKDAAISAVDQGLSYGWGVFETIRVYNRVAFMLNEHLSRMFSSAENLHISLPMNEYELTENIKKFIECIKPDNFILKIILSKGTNNVSSLIFTHREIPYTKKDYEKGYSAQISSIRCNASSPIVYMKTLNYMENILARQEVQKSNCNEALFINTEGFLSEGSMSNLFFVKDKKIFTPAKTCGLLPGIIRNLVIEKLSKLAGFEVFQGEYCLEQLLEADEAFITNSAIQIMPLSKVNGVDIGCFPNIPVTKGISDAYIDSVSKFL